MDPSILKENLWSAAIRSDDGDHLVDEQKVDHLRRNAYGLVGAQCRERKPAHCSDAANCPHKEQHYGRKTKEGKNACKCGKEWLPEDKDLKLKGPLSHYQIWKVRLGESILTLDQMLEYVLTIRNNDEVTAMKLEGARNSNHRYMKHGLPLIYFLFFDNRTEGERRMKANQIKEITQDWLDDEQIESALRATTYNLTDAAKSQWSALMAMEAMQKSEYTEKQFARVLKYANYDPAAAMKYIAAKRYRY